MISSSPVLSILTVVALVLPYARTTLRLSPGACPACGAHNVKRRSTHTLLFACIICTWIAVVADGWWVLMIIPAIAFAWMAPAYGARYVCGSCGWRGPADTRRALLTGGWTRSVN